MGGHCIPGQLKPTVQREPVPRPVSGVCAELCGTEHYETLERSLETEGIIKASCECQPSVAKRPRFGNEFASAQLMESSFMSFLLTMSMEDATVSMEARSC